MALKTAILYASFCKGAGIVCECSQGSGLSSADSVCWEMLMEMPLKKDDVVTSIKLIWLNIKMLGVNSLPLRLCLPHNYYFP